MEQLSMQQSDRILNKLRQQFVSNVLPESIIDFLISDEILNDEQEQIILAERTDQGKSRKILQFVKGSGYRGLTSLAEALKENHRFLYDLLKQGINSELAESRQNPSGGDNPSSFNARSENSFLSPVRGDNCSSYTVPIPVDENHMYDVADFLSSRLMSAGPDFSCRDLGRSLNLDEGTLVNLYRRYNNDVRTLISQIVIAWFEASSAGANIQQLELALRNMGRNQTANDLMEQFPHY